MFVLGCWKQLIAFFYTTTLKKMLTTWALLLKKGLDAEFIN